MAYRQVEPIIEQALKTAFDSVTDSTVAYRTWWSADDGAGVDEVATYAQINIAAFPNVPAGWRVSERDVPVTVEIATYAPDDPTHSEAFGLYHKVRAVLDTHNFTNAAFRAFDVSITDGGSVFETDRRNHIVLALSAKVCVDTA